MDSLTAELPLRKLCTTVKTVVQKITDIPHQEQ